MPVIDFKLSDNQKYTMLWNLLNPNFNEDGGYVMEYSIMDIYDDYAIAYDIQNQNYERVYYTKDDANDSLEITSTEVTYIVDVTESEKKALEALQTMNNNSFEKLDEDFSALKEEVETLNGSINSLNEEKEALSVELEEVKNNFTEATTTIENLTEENNTLAEFKSQVEKMEKEAIIDKYADKLNEDVVNEFREKVDEYSAVDLEKELAFTLVNTTPTLFSNDSKGFVPKDGDEPKTGLSAVLDKYE